MIKLLQDFFRQDITKEQSKDTGMAMVLILLLLSASLKRPIFLKAAVLALLIDMTFPRFYRPVAIVWLGLSNLLGAIASKILLTLVFFVVLTPIGLTRRVLGYDSLQLRKFKASKASVMTIRNHEYSGKDLEKPY